MARMDSYVEYTLELLEPLGPVRARAMFGGWGLYHGGRMFGLIVEDRLYLKTDDTTRAAFASAGGEPFVYDAGKGRKPVTMSYSTPPSDASDDAQALLPWARRAVDAALRAAQKKPAAKKNAAPAERSAASSEGRPALTGKRTGVKTKTSVTRKTLTAKKTHASVRKKPVRPSSRRT